MVWRATRGAARLGQFIQDAVSHKSGLGSLAGPTIEQLADAKQVVGGREQFGSFALKALPANALYASIAGGQVSDPTFSD